MEEPLDWDDMDPAQRHTWLRDHPSPKFIHIKLMNTETRNLSKTQQTRLLRIKKPKLFDIKSLDTEQPTAIRCPTSQDSPHKRNIDDDIKIDQPTSKQPRQLSPSHNTPSNLEPPPNEDDLDPPPTLANYEKRQQQQNDTRDNKKQKQQENAILLTITETHSPQLDTSSDPASTPTDPLLETLAIPTPPQIVPQLHITDSSTNEISVNYPNQEQTTTRIHEFKHHSLPTIEPPSESLSQEPEITTKISSEATTIEPPPDNTNHDPDTTEESVMPKPPDWNTYSKSKRAHWRKRHGKRQTPN
jgi:hypothetical protein